MLTMQEGDCWFCIHDKATRQVLDCLWFDGQVNSSSSSRKREEEATNSTISRAVMCSILLCQPGTSVPRAFQASPGPPQVQRILRHLVQCLCLLCLASHNANAKFQHQKAKSQSVMFAFTAITRYQVQLGSRLAIQQGTVRGGCVRWDFLCALQLQSFLLSKASSEFHRLLPELCTSQFWSETPKTHQTLK